MNINDNLPEFFYIISTLKNRKLLGGFSKNALRNPPDAFQQQNLEVFMSQNNNDENKKKTSSNPDEETKNINK